MSQTIQAAVETIKAFIQWRSDKKLIVPVPVGVDEAFATLLAHVTKPVPEDLRERAENHAAQETKDATAGVAFLSEDVHRYAKHVGVRSYLAGSHYAFSFMEQRLAEKDAMMAERAKSQPAETGDVMPFHGWVDLLQVEQKASGWLVCTNTLVMDTGGVKAVAGYMYPCWKAGDNWSFLNVSGTGHSCDSEFIFKYFRQATTVEYTTAVEAGRIPGFLRDTAKQSSELPEKWCIERTPENAEMVNAWANIGESLPFYCTVDGYIHSDKVSNINTEKASRMMNDCGISPGYSPITDDQFRRLVLKQS